MRILLTGGSSFTGLWFAESLKRAGHEVIAPLPRSKDAYEGIRAQRVTILSEAAEIIWSCPFGSDAFLQLATKGPWDRLCHHAAQVGDYKSANFDVTAAVAVNTKNLAAILQSMKAQGLAGVVLTGSVFENDEGIGTEPLRAFSPYGTSKALTAEVFRVACAQQDMPLTKFVIPNPFGPFEEPRFCSYLIKRWKAGQVAAVNTPAYVRDNIHVSLLALAYADAVKDAGKEAFRHIGPSGYVETQGAFAERFAAEIGKRLGIACRLDLAKQTEFLEPEVRVNTDPVDGARFGWNETKAWDDLASYYRG